MLFDSTTYSIYSPQQPPWDTWFPHLTLHSFFINMMLMIWVYMSTTPPVILQWSSSFWLSWPKANVNLPLWSGYLPSALKVAINSILLEKWALDTDLYLTSLYCPRCWRRWLLLNSFNKVFIQYTTLKQLCSSLWMTECWIWHCGSQYH